MLNPFPDLLAFGLLAPTFLRIIVGVVLLLRIRGQKNISGNLNHLKRFVYLIGSILLILGAFTQYSSIALSLALLYEIFYEPESKEKRTTNLILLAITISLLFLGAGFLAIDLPL